MITTKVPRDHRPAAPPAPDNTRAADLTRAHMVRLDERWHHVTGVLTLDDGFTRVLISQARTVLFGADQLVPSRGRGAA